jgi:phosphoglycerol transferase
MTSPLSRRDWKRAALLVPVTICLWLWARSLWREQGWLAPPEYDIDVLETFARIKLASEQGLSSFVTRVMPRLGAPFGADWSSYPMPDAPVFWVLGKVSKFCGLITTGHLAILFAYLANVLTFYFCSRTLGHRAPFAACAALLFGFSHYNISRGLSHYSFMLSFTAPAILLASWLVGSSREFLHRRRWQVFCLVTAAVTGTGNPYFGLMFVMLVVMALLYQVLTSRRAENLLTGVAALFVWGLVTGASHFAAIASMLSSERKVLVRSYESTELYGLRPIEWVVPPPYHRLPGAAEFTQEYGRFTHFEGEHFSSYLGAIGIAGLLLVVGRFVGALLRGRGGLRPAYVATVGFIVAFGMVGGLNSALALSVTVVFRAGNRYTVFILAVGLFALAALASVKWRGLPRAWKCVIVAILLCGGLWDQMRPAPIVDDLIVRARGPELDWRLGNHLEDPEKGLPPGSMIFQLPAVPFLEQKPIVGMTDYEQFRPFFFTKTMRFSYGVLATEDAMVWQRRVARMAPAEMRAELEKVGFAAVYVCRSAYLDGAKALRKSFEEAGMKVTFDAGPHLLFRLQPSTSPQLPVLTGPNRHEPWDGVATEAGKLVVLEGDGWFPAERSGTSYWRWGAQEATCILWNPTKDRKAVRINCSLMGLRAHELSVHDGKGNQLWRGMLKNVGIPCSFELELDPGESQLQWVLHGAPVRASPSDRRLLGFRVNDLVVAER